jgi:KaiC/GvpD/RAD55 family RecA-like ATPase
MDEAERIKEVRRWLIIKKMRMTNHATRAFRVKIERGRGLVLESATQE